jgi:hypothetical protein
MAKQLTTAGMHLAVTDAGHALDIRFSFGDAGPTSSQDGVFYNWRPVGAWVWWRETRQLEDNAPHIVSGWSSEPWTRELAERVVAAAEGDG